MVQIRALQLDDIAHAIAIEQLCQPSPWSERHFSDCLTAQYHCSALLIDEILIGYLIVSVVLDEAQILNFCIDPPYQSQNKGQYLLDSAIAALEQQDVKKVFLEVRLSNTRAQQFYIKNHFEVIGMRPAYYPSNNGREDALIMYRLLETRYNTSP